MKWSIECEQILAFFEWRYRNEWNPHKLSTSNEVIGFVYYMRSLSAPIHISYLQNFPNKTNGFTIYRYVDNKTLIRFFFFLFVAVAFSSIGFVPHAKSYANFEWDEDHQDMNLYGETSSMSRYRCCQCLIRFIPFECARMIHISRLNGLEKLLSQNI